MKNVILAVQKRYIARSCIMHAQLNAIDIKDVSYRSQTTDNWNTFTMRTDVIPVPVHILFSYQKQVKKQSHYTFPNSLTTDMEKQYNVKPDTYLDS